MTTARKGFSLVEGTVATTIVSVVLLSLARVAFFHSNTVASNRRAALEFESTKFSNVAFTNLAAWSTSDRVITRGTFSYTRQTKITTIDPMHYSVRIVVVPTEDPARKDSVTVDVTMP